MKSPSKIFLSQLDKNLNLQEIIDYCLDNNIATIINDYTELPQIEYDLSDLDVVWDSLSSIHY